MKIKFLLYSLLLLCVQQSCTTSKKLSPEQETLIYYLYSNSLISDTFANMVYHMPICMRGYDVDNKKLYFLFKRTMNRATVLQTICIDTSQAEFAPCTTGECEFGGLKGNIDSYYAFRIDEKNIKADGKMQVHCDLKSYPFDVTLAEMVASKDSLSSFNYTKNFKISSQYKAANIGAYISKRDKDPIIKRLAMALTKGLTTNEEKAQKLLDFVSSEILYSYEDIWYQSEITKRAHEVLISGIGDCSGKSTLYASLLEQCQIPYCLLYYNKHINVGVKGNFPKFNALRCVINNETYFMAETTAPKFIIGMSSLQNEAALTTVIFYQFPSVSENIYTASDNAKAVLFNDED